MFPGPDLLDTVGVCMRKNLTGKRGKNLHCVRGVSADTRPASAIKMHLLPFCLNIYIPLSKETGVTSHETCH